MISIFLNKKKDGKLVMEPVREASGFAKFVKEKYKEFKKPGVKHAEVMRQISSQYSTLSQEEKKMYWSMAMKNNYSTDDNTIEYLDFVII